MGSKTNISLLCDKKIFFFLDAILIHTLRKCFYFHRILSYCFVKYICKETNKKGVGLLTLTSGVLLCCNSFVLVFYLCCVSAAQIQALTLQ